MCKQTIFDPSFIPHPERNPTNPVPEQRNCARKPSSPRRANNDSAQCSASDNKVCAAPATTSTCNRTDLPSDVSHLEALVSVFEVISSRIHELQVRVSIAVHDETNVRRLQQRHRPNSERNAQLLRKKYTRDQRMRLSGTPSTRHATPGASRGHHHR